MAIIGFHLNYLTRLNAFMLGDIWFEIMFKLLF